MKIDIQMPVLRLICPWIWVELLKVKVLKIQYNVIEKKTSPTGQQLRAKLHTTTQVYNTYHANKKKRRTSSFINEEDRKNYQKNFLFKQI